MDSMNTNAPIIKYLHHPEELVDEVRASNIGDVFVTVDDSTEVMYMCITGQENLSPMKKCPTWIQVMDNTDDNFQMYCSLATGISDAGCTFEEVDGLIPKLKVGDKVYVPNEKRPYKVKCRDNRYIICTKPMNLYRTVLYFIIDLHRALRGPDNMVFCSGYETDEQCQERLKELQEGKIEVSMRRSVKLDVLVQ